MFDRRRTTQSTDVEDLKYRLALGQARDNQNFGLSLVAGSAAALIGAVAWAMISYVTEMQIGFMAIGIGLLVGWAIRVSGRGVDKVYGVLGAVLSLLGCVIGNLLMIVAVIANKEGMKYFETLAVLNLDTALRLMKAAFNPIDLLFYGLAVYWGYKYSIASVSPLGTQTSTQEKKSVPPASSSGS